MWPFLAWAGMATLVFTLFWPAMWVDPIGSVQKILSEATNYASEGHHAPTFFNGQIFETGISDWHFYPVNYLWRTTPPVLIGLIITGIASVFRRRLSFFKDQQRAVFILFLFAVLYTVFMTLGAKKFDRYLIPIFAPLALVAGMGWGIVIQNAYEWVAAHWNMGSNTRHIARFGATSLLTLVILIQLAGALQTFPYYLTYYNPLMGGNKKAPEVMMIGWGEGLDQAARYLNAKPDSNTLRVQSWYPVGPFSFFFDGKTINKDYVANPEWLEKADYYVLYFHQWQRERPSKAFMRYFDQQVPEYIVNIDGLEYARIYSKDALIPLSQTE
jgi:4-amino-4-deoxy-L-arabinose transferase-like glycosyltransferase